MDPRTPFFDPTQIVAEISLQCAEATVVVRVSSGGDCSCALVTAPPNPLPQAPTPGVISRVIGLAGFPRSVPNQVVVPLGFNRASRVLRTLEHWLGTGQASEYGWLFPLEPEGFIFYADTTQAKTLLLNDAREAPLRDRITLHVTEAGAACFLEAAALLAPATARTRRT